MKFYIGKLKEYKELDLIHKCSFIPKSQYSVNKENYLYGDALDNEIYYNKYDDNFLIGNGEYCSIINNCPWCGILLNTIFATMSDKIHSDCMEYAFGSHGQG